MNPNRRTVLSGGVLGAAALMGAGSRADAAEAVTSKIPRGDVSGWKQVLAQDFSQDVPLGGFVVGQDGLASSGSALRAKYGSAIGGYPDGWDFYQPSKTVTIKGSVLDISMFTSGGSPHSAAVYPIRADTGSPSQLYGRWQWRMRALQVSGTGWLSCSMLWPQNDADWPGAGELNWPEGELKGPVQGFVHYAGPTRPQLKVFAPSSFYWTQWRIYTIEWLPGLVRYLVDDTVVAHVTEGVPNTPMRWVLQTNPSTSAVPYSTAHMQLDWISIYDPA